MSSAPILRSVAVRLEQPTREGRQHFLRGLQLVSRRRRQDVLHGGLDRTLGRLVETPARRGQAEQQAAPVAWIAAAVDQTAVLETLQDPGQRTGVEVQELGERPGRDAREATDDPEHEPLGPRHPELSGHALGRTLQRVIERPDEAHEIQDVTESRSLFVELVATHPCEANST